MDNTLKIRIDVETATLRQLGNEVNRLNGLLKDLNPNSKEFAEAKQQAFDLSEKMKDLSNHVQRTREEISPTSQKVADLTASMKIEDATISQLNKAVKESTVIYKENFTATDRSSAAGQAFAATISETKTRVAEATKVLLSENGKLIQSYFANGDVLRKMALEGGGYVSNLQIEQLATKLASDGNINLADAMELVRAKMQEQNIATKNFSVTINEMNTELEGEVGTLGEATQANEAHRRAVEQLSREKNRVAQATQSGADAETNASAKVRTAYGAELGAIEQLLITKNDLIKARELIPASEVERLEQFNAELAQVNRQLYELQGRGLKNVRQSFQDSAFQINRTHQSLFALSFLMNGFSSENATGEQAKFSRALTNGTSTALGATFAIQSMGSGMAAIAGPAGIAVGALSALVAYLNSADEASKKAANEGLKQFRDSLTDISSSNQLELRSNLEEKLRAINNLLDKSKAKLFDLSRTEQVGGVKDFVSKEQLDAALKSFDLSSNQRDILEKMKKELQDQLDTNKVLIEIQKQSGELLGTQLTRTGKMDAALKILNEELKTGLDFTTKEALTQEQITGVVDRIALITRQRNESLKSTAEKNADIVATERVLVQLGQSNLSNLIEELKQAKEQTDDEKKRLEYAVQIQGVEDQKIALLRSQYEIGDATLDQVKNALELQLAEEKSDERRVAIKSQILNLVSKEASLEAERTKLRGELTQFGIVPKNIDEQRKSINDLQDFTRKTMLGLVDEEFTKRKLANEDQHARDMANLEQKQADLLNALQDDQDAVDAIAAENARYNKVNGDIELDRAEKIKKFKLDAAQAEFDLKKARGEDTYDDEIALIKQKYDVERQQLANEKIGPEEFGIRMKILDIDEANEQVEALTNKWSEFLTPLQDALTQTGDAITRDIIQKTIGATSVFQKFVGVVLEGLSQMLVKMIAMSVVGSILKIVTGGLFSGGGQIGKVVEEGPTLAKEGGSIPSGTFVVNEKRSAQYQELLDVLGAKEAKGGVAHEDSIFAGYDERKRPVVVTPRERLLDPEFEVLGHLMNEGKLKQEEARIIVETIRGGTKPKNKPSVIESTIDSQKIMRTKNDTLFDIRSMGVQTRNHGGIIDTSPFVSRVARESVVYVDRSGGFNQDRSSVWNPGKTRGIEKMEISLNGEFIHRGRNMIAVIKEERVIDKKLGGGAL